MLPVQNLNRNLVSKLIAGIAVILVMAGGFGCLSAPATPLEVTDIDLKLDNGTEICTTVEYLDAMKAEAYKAGQLSGCQADIVLSNPTYTQLQQFLADNQALRMCEGDCIDHTIDLNEAAIKDGYAMLVVLLNGHEAGTGHVIGAFQTDKGLIFIESQTLWEVEVKVGKDYADNFHKHGWDFPTLVIKKIGILR